MRPGEGHQAGSRGLGPRRLRGEPGGATPAWRLSWDWAPTVVFPWHSHGHLRVTLGSENIVSSPRTCPKLQGDCPQASSSKEHC